MVDEDEAGTVGGSWDEAYTKGWAPWDIGRPQPVFIRLADAGEIASPVLDKVGRSSGSRRRGSR